MSSPRLGPWSLLTLVLTASPLAAQAGGPGGAARTDFWGDPLPAGAVARLASLRWRVDGNPLSLRYSPDGKTMLVVSKDVPLLLHQLDAASGRHLGSTAILCGKGTASNLSDPAGWCISPDGCLLVEKVDGAEKGDTLIVRDLRRGQTVLKLTSKLGCFDYVRFSSDGRRLAATELCTKKSAGEEQPSEPPVVIRLWELASGKEIAHLGGEKANTAFRARVFTLAPNGRRLAVLGTEGENEGVLRLWDLDNPRTSKRLGTAASDSLLAFSPDSTLLVSNAKNRPCLWDVAIGKRTRRIRPFDHECQKIAFSPDGKHLAILEGGTLHQCSVTAEEELPTFGDEVHTFSFSPDGKMLALVESGRTVRVIDRSTGKDLQRWDNGALACKGGELEEQCLLNEQGAGAPVAFSPDGGTLAAVNRTGGMRRWSMSTGKELLPPPGLKIPCRQLALSADGKLLAGSNLDVVSLWDMGSGKLLCHLAPSPVALGDSEPLLPWAQLSPDGRRLAAGWSDGTVSVWDVPAGKHLWTRRLGEEAIGPLAFAEGGRRLISSAGGPSEQRLVWQDAETGRLTRDWRSRPDGKLRALQSLSPGGWLAVSLGPDGRKVWELSTGTLRQRLEPSLHGPCYMSADGRLLLACELDILVLQEVASGKVLRHVQASGLVHDASFSANGSLIAAACKGGIDLWDSATGSPLARLQGHLGGANAVAFTPDGRHLISSGQDLSVLVWDLPAVLRKPPPDEPKEAELPALWQGLAAQDACKAGAALARLAASRQAVPFVQARLRAAAAAALHSPAEELRCLRAIEALEPRGGEAWPLLEAVASLETTDAIRRAARGALGRLSFARQRKSLVPTSGQVDDLGQPLPAAARLRLGSQRFQHGAEIDGLRYLPNGKTLLSATASFSPDHGHFYLWDACSGRQRHVMEASLPFLGMEAGVALRGPPLSWALSADCRLLARVEVATSPAGERHFLRVRELATDKLLFEVADPEAEFSSLQFSPDGQRLAALCSGKDCLRLYRLPEGTELGQARAPSADPTFWPFLLTFSPAGSHLAVLGREEERVRGDARVCIYDPYSLRRPLLLPQESLAFSPVAFTPDERGLAVVSRPGKGGVAHVRIWDVLSGALLRDLGKHPEPALALLFSRDGKLLVSQQAKRVQMWDMTSGKELPGLTLKEEEYSVVLSPDGRTLAVATLKSIRLYAPPSGKLLHELKADPGTLFRAASEGSRFYEQQQGRGQGLAFSPDGKVLAAAQGQTIRRWEVATAKEIDPAPIRCPVSVLALSADGQRVAVAAEQQVYLWDATGRLRHQLRLEPRPVKPAAASSSAPEEPPTICSLAMTPEGGQVAAGLSRGDVAVWQADGKKLWQGHCTGEEPMLTFGDDGRTLLTAVRSQQVFWHDALTGRLVRHLATGKQKAASSRADDEVESPGGVALAGSRLLVCAKKDLQLWELASGQCRRLALRDEEGCIFSVGHSKLTLSEDGRLLVVAGSDRLHLVDPVTGKLQRTCSGLSSLAGRVLSPDGRLLAAAGLEGVLLWNTADGTLLAHLQGHRGAATAVAFSADGRTLATAAEDSTVLLWDLPALLDRPSLSPLSGAESDALWRRLADPDARKAYHAARRLAQDPSVAITLFRKHLSPLAAPEPAQVARWIAALESDFFAAREKAAAELALRGEQVEGALRKALASHPSEEQRRQIIRLLERNEEAVWDREKLRQLRAVELLEGLGTPEARRLLEALAGGDPEARLTREAKAALGRLPRQGRTQRYLDLTSKRIATDAHR